MPKRDAYRARTRAVARAYRRANRRGSADAVWLAALASTGTRH